MDLYSFIKINYNIFIFNYNIGINQIAINKALAMFRGKYLKFN